MLSSSSSSNPSHIVSGNNEHVACLLEVLALA